MTLLSRPQFVRLQRANFGMASRKPQQDERCLTCRRKGVYLLCKKRKKKRKKERRKNKNKKPSKMLLNILKV